MSAGDIAVYLVAFMAIAFLILSILRGLITVVRNWRGVAADVRWSILVIVYAALTFIPFAVAAVIGINVWLKVSDDRMMQQCMTAYERREKAYAAPEDYFGRELRLVAEEEAKQCARFAARKQAASTGN